ncbi:MAG: hypothetical protein IKM76_08830 [Prevotella sp.]|nr:hypothetical protein [Prevotella sp.]
MKKKQFLKTTFLALLLLALAGGVATAQTDEVTLASWDLTGTYNETTDGTNAYYTWSSATTQSMSDAALSAKKPYFYPNSVAAGLTSTNYWVTYNSSNTSKTWKKDTGRGLYINVAQNAISDLTAATDNDGANYYEIKFNATGYKALNLSYGIYYGGSAVINYSVVVSADGGSTWQIAGTSYATKSHWNTIANETINLATDNCSNVLVRIIPSNDVPAQNWCLKTVELKGTTYTGDGTDIFTVTAGADDVSHGYVTIAPTGGKVVTGTAVTATAYKKSGYVFSKWQDNSTGASFATTVTANTTITATFTPVATYTLSVSKAGTGAAYAPSTYYTLSPEPTAGKYEEGTVVTITAHSNDVSTFAKWDDETTTATHTVTMNSDQSVTLTYDMTPFLAFWNFASGGSSNHKPDMYTNDIFKDVTLNLFKSDGTQVTSGLSENTLSNEDNSASLTFNGKQRNTPWSSETSRYFMIQLSTIGYKNIRIRSYIEAWTSNTYNTQLIQYSYDGTAWTDLASKDFTNNQRWHLLEGTNTALDNQPTLYLRWINSGDKRSGFSASGTEDVRIGEVVVYGEVGYDLTVGAAKAATLVLPFAATIPANVSAYTLTYTAGNSKVNASEVTTTIPQNTPVLINAEAGTYSFEPADGATVDYSSAPYTNGALTGVYTAGYVPADSYVLQNGADGLGFYKVTADNTIRIGAYRAYLTAGQDAKARMISIVFNDDMTTGIGNITSAPSKDEGVAYNLAGQRVANGYKSLVIKNGKKYIIK